LEISSGGETLIITDGDLKDQAGQDSIVGIYSEL
jgi:hypothetical protein